MQAISFSGVTKTYPDGTCALRDLNLDIEEGEFLVLVGPSGCGKSTALRMIAGLEDISEGELRIGDARMNELAPQARDVAMIFQNYALYPHMTVYENIAFPLRTRGMASRDVDDVVVRTATRLGLSSYLKRHPGRLSGGQRQRVAMARAMVREPKAFLMDEPLSNLDAKLRVQMRAEISRLQHELGVTTIYVTHDQIEAMTMGTRIAVMRHGELQQLGTPKHIYEHPSNLFVATFIGSPSMNLVEAELSREGAGLRCHIGNQSFALPDSLMAVSPGIGDYVGRTIALGVRPEHLVDPMRREEHEPRLRGRSVLVEELGAEKHVLLEMDGRPVQAESALDAARNDDGSTSEDLFNGGGNKVRLMARFDPRTAVDWNEELEIVVDTDFLHFFDLNSGISLRAGSAAQIG